LPNATPKFQLSTYTCVIPENPISEAAYIGQFTACVIHIFIFVSKKRRTTYSFPNYSYVFIAFRYRIDVIAIDKARLFRSGRYGI